jgi:nitroreductase
MNMISNQDLIKQLEWRYAVKKFDPQKKISQQDWQAIEKSLVLTPSSYGLQPWKFIVVQTPELRKKLTPLSWNQKQVENCSHYVVFANKTGLDEKYIEDFISLNCQVRNVPKEKLEGYKKMMIGDLLLGERKDRINEWASRQCYIALGNLMTTVAVMGIDACPMEGIEPKKYDEVLGLEGSGYQTCVACAVGYRSSEDFYSKLAKVRFSAEQVVIHK